MFGTLDTREDDRNHRMSNKQHVISTVVMESFVRKASAHQATIANMIEENKKGLMINFIFYVFFLNNANNVALQVRRRLKSQQCKLLY